MEYKNETWVSCTFSQSGLDGSSELVKEYHPELSFVQCIVLAMALDWAYLVILGATRGCTLYEINAYAVGAVTRDAIGGDSRCKTPDRVIGCPDGNIFHPVGQVVEEIDHCSILKEERICTENGNFEWQDSTDPTPPLTSCTPPFVQESVGCMYIDQDCWRLVQNSEKICQFMGGKMASPRTNSDFVALKDYLNTEYTHWNDQFHAAVEYDAGTSSWVWMYNGRPTETSEWEWENLPSETTGCVVLAIYSNYKLKYHPCEDKMLLCMADLV